MNNALNPVARRLLAASVLLILLLLSFNASNADAAIWTVTVPTANVRAQPVAGAALVAQLSTGDQVKEISRQGIWLKVRLNDGREAWMHEVTLTQAIHLFGLPLDRVSRDELRQAIHAASVQVIREIDDYSFDLYDPGPWLADATEMAVGYTDTSLFAVAEITFRSANDLDQVRNIAERIREQLGPWQVVSGRRSEGPVEFRWQRGAIDVLVHRGWPDTSTYLTYEAPERMQQLLEALRDR